MSQTPTIWLAMRLDLSENAPDGPGWYAYAARDNGVSIIDPVRLDEDSARMMGEAFSDALDLDEGLTFSSIVESGTSLIRAAVIDQLGKAEAQALRVAKLRRLSAQLNPEENQEKESEAK